MKIAIYISSLKKGGAERVTVNLANYFTKRNDTVAIVMIDEGSPDYEVDEKVELVHLYKMQNNQKVADKLKYNYRIIRTLRMYLKKRRFDVLLSMGAGNLYQAVAAGKGIVKVIGSERTNPFMAYSRKELLWNKFFYYLSDGYIFQTKGAQSCYGAKGAVIHNPVSRDFTVSEKGAERKGQWGFCAVGRLVSAKNYGHMIKMFSRLHAIDQRYTLHIYGGGPEESRLRNRIAAAGAQDYIKLCGNTDQVSQILKTYRFFLICSHYEGMPNALLEAMACGCICIAADFDFGPSEVIQNGKNGFLIPQKDADALKKCMAQIIGRQVDLEAVSKEAARTVQNYYRIGYIARQYRNYFREVVCGCWQKR